MLGRLVSGVAFAAAALATVPDRLCAQAPARLSPDEVISRLEERDAARQAALQSYISQRRYSAENPRVHKGGYMVVELRYQAPESKSYRVVEKGGSGSVHSRVFKPLLDAEVEQSSAAGRAATGVSRRNYRFTYSRFDEQARAYIFDAEPLTANKYLFRGKVWIDAADFAVQRIEGEPAQRPSFWVRKTHFVREYGKFGQFWFPVRHRTQVEVWLLGPATMDIDYFNYSWEPGLQAPSGSNIPGTSPQRSPD